MPMLKLRSRYGTPTGAIDKLMNVFMVRVMLDLLIDMRMYSFLGRGGVGFLIKINSHFLGFAFPPTASQPKKYEYEKFLLL